MGHRTRAIASAAFVTLCTASACTPDEKTDPSLPLPTPTTVEQNRFRDVGSSLTDLPTESSSYGAAFVDYDLDGWADLLVGRHQGHARFLINDGGAFSERVERSLLAPAPGRIIYDRHACAWGEANGDGLPDLLCTSGADAGEGKGPNKLLLQGRTGGLRDAAETFGVADPLGRGRSVNWFDLEGDGDLDVFVGNEIRPGFPSRLFENIGDGFVSLDDPVADDFPVRSSSWADWENDGDPDLLVLGHGFVASRAFTGTGTGFREIDVPGITGVEWLSAALEDLDGDADVDAVLVSERETVLFTNEGGRLARDRRFGLTEGRAALPLDADNDGDLDLFVVRGAPGDPPDAGAVNEPDVLLLNDEGNFRTAWFDVEGPRTGNGENAVVADYDRDGRIDVFVGNGYLNVEGRFELLRNELTGGNWIAVVLRGPDRNPVGIGARVTVRSDHTTQHRFVTDEVVFRGQSTPGIVHFGIGDDQEAEIRVRWPDGRSSCTRTHAGETLVFKSEDPARC